MSGSFAAEVSRVGRGTLYEANGAMEGASIGSNRFEVGVVEKFALWLARYRLFQVSTQILEDFLLALLDFKKDRLRQSRVVLPRMNCARLQEDPAEIAHALLRDKHLVVGLNHGSTSSTIPRF
jgi:hypothetical protein